MSRPSPVQGLLGAAAWAGFGGLALALLLPPMPGFRTLMAGLSVLLFVLALAAPRAAFGAALVATTGLGFAAIPFGSPEPVAALSAVLAGYLAGASLRGIYELEASPEPPMLASFRAYAAVTGVSALAALAAARTAYLLARGVPLPRVVNGLGTDARGAMAGALAALAAAVLMAGMYHAAARLSRDVKGRRAVDAALVLAALVPGVVALAQKTGLLPLWRAGRWEEWERVQATFSDPSAAGVGVVLLLPTLLARIGRGTPGIRAAAAVGAGLLLVLLADAGSRAGFLGSVLAAGILALWALTRLAAGAGTGARRRLALSIALVALLAGGAFGVSLFTRPEGSGPPMLVSRLAQTFTRGSTPAEGETGRLVLYEAGVELFRRHPVAGIGLGEFRVRFPDVARELGRDVRWTDHPPSLYLGTLVESGLSGGIVLALLLTAILRGIVGALSFRERASEDALRSASAAASLVGLLLIFLFGSHLVYAEIAVLTGVLAARLPFPPDGKTRRFLLAVVPVALAGSLVLLLGSVAARLWESRTPDAAFAHDAHAGVHYPERDSEGRFFRWTAPVFALRAGEEGRPGVLRLPVRNARPDRQPVRLRVFWDDAARGEVEIPAGSWRELRLPVAGRGVLRGEVAPPLRPRADARVLGIAIGPARVAP